VADDADASTRQLTDIADAAEVEPRDRDSRTVQLALIVGLVVVAAVGALAGWLGMQSAESREQAAQRELFLNVGRQGALDLTTIAADDAEAAIQRILDSSTGTFRDDFENNSGPFLDVLKKTQASSQGTITEAGVESLSGDQAQVLVTVSIKTVTPGVPDQPARLWRMRIGVQKADDGAKVSDVAFVS
jgi:Mce-associated membrane protein